MPSWLPAIAYPPEQEGYWAPITSTLDWCEENYTATRYSAEIVNTLTNLFFMYLALKGIKNCLKMGHDGIFLITFSGCFIVAVGSFAFHSTLKYPMQLVDELSMIYTTCLMCDIDEFFATFSYARSFPIKLALGIFSASLALLITGYYHYLQDPTFHQHAYAILTAIVLFRSIFVMEVNIRPYFRRRRQRRGEVSQNGVRPKTDGFAENRNSKRDKQILRVMWTMIAVGLSVFLGGFAFWTVDNVQCSRLRSLRREVGLPWGIFLEGHGWWHLMTGYGAYFYITWGVWLRHCLNGRQDEFQMVWPSLLTSLPRVERCSSVANGNSKKLR